MADPALTFSDFEPLVGEAFTVATDSGTLELELIEAVERPPDGRVAPGFTLLFRSPPGAEVLAQQTFPLTHPELGTRQIFMVPVAAEDSGVQYEAVFA